MRIIELSTEDNNDLLSLPNLWLTWAVPLLLGSLVQLHSVKGNRLEVPVATLTCLEAGAGGWLGPLVSSLHGLSSPDGPHLLHSGIYRTCSKGMTAEPARPLSLALALTHLSLLEHGLSQSKPQGHCTFEGAKTSPQEGAKTSPRVGGAARSRCRQYAHLGRGALWPLGDQPVPLKRFRFPRV